VPIAKKETRGGQRKGIYAREKKNGVKKRGRSCFFQQGTFSERCGRGAVLKRTTGWHDKVGGYRIGHKKGGGNAKPVGGKFGRGKKRG